MRKTTLALTSITFAMSAMSASASLIVGWETWGPNVAVGGSKNVGATQLATGATGSAFIPGAASGTVNNAVNNVAGANNSGTFGTLVGASTDVTAFNSGLKAGTTDTQYFEFTVTADTGYELSLDSFHFDTAMGGNQNTRTWTVSALSGSITLGTIQSGIYADYNGLVQEDIDLTGLADHTLAAGESATFRMDFVGNANGGNGILFDNAAIGGVVTAVPEPSTFLPMILGGVGVVLMRRRRRGLPVAI